MTSMQDLANRARENPHAPLIDRIVVPVGGSADELIVHQWAVETAAALGSMVHAVHVATGAEDPPDDFFSFLDQMARNHGVRIDHAVLHAPEVAAELTAELDANDLVVIGTRHLGTEYHMGSVAQALVRNAPCPVQVIRIE